MSRVDLGEPMRVGRVTLTPVVRTTTSTWTGPSGLTGLAVRVPVAIVCETADRRWALDLDGTVIDADAW